MKIEDLIINDLVIFNEEVHKVKGIYGSSCMLDLMPYYLKNKKGEYLLPITKHISVIGPFTLTSEILKSNFKLVEGWDDLYRISGRICYDFEHNLLCNLINDLAFPICEIYSVHELQHALRLCRLSELADNFKVE